MALMVGVSITMLPMPWSITNHIFRGAWEKASFKNLKEASSGLLAL